MKSKNNIIHVFNIHCTDKSQKKPTFSEDHVWRLEQRRLPKVWVGLTTRKTPLFGPPNSPNFGETPANLPRHSGGTPGHGRNHLGRSDTFNASLGRWAGTEETRCRVRVERSTSELRRRQTGRAGGVTPSIPNVRAASLSTKFEYHFKFETHTLNCPCPSLATSQLKQVEHDFDDDGEEDDFDVDSGEEEDGQKLTDDEDDGTREHSEWNNDEMEQLEKEYRHLHHQELDTLKNLKHHKDEDLLKGQALKSQKV
ncbi:hypothetical protein LR48_Vigan09g084000 [Vigna angularis]|uniref:Uncharacterized protein n=1 Tax=Phaseolus angularis TaxID=3914 RepID=A0A0L9VAT5_PHAAN|nr:hypothetical protein LR48_Vigan09g084000 [Vigna angularis]